jgi:hypothetical protein
MRVKDARGLVSAWLEVIYVQEVEERISFPLRVQILPAKQTRDAWDIYCTYIFVQIYAGQLRCHHQLYWLAVIIFYSTVGYEVESSDITFLNMIFRYLRITD